MPGEFDRTDDESGEVGNLPGTDTLSDSSNPSESGPEAHPKSLLRRRVTLVSLLLTVLAAGIVLPPLVNVGRYQRQITALMARSLGRPVHLSGVELRLLPTPGFVLHDLSVSEDPSFGAEPILSARTVVATVRLLSLWRGKLEVSRVSVDEASVNLVRTAQGRWNLESVLMGAAQNSAGSVMGGGRSARTVAIPYLEATNSRVNLKNGSEKSPFSIVDTDLSLWQDEPGVWRVRLKGQPVRTDMDISLADTGEVRMEASVHTAAQLREMPLTLQVEWRDAQLGQLSRLLLGSDAGWRGDLTADMEVQGTPDAAVTKARLRATGVRRQEFTPETPLDFDANCSFRYQHSVNAAHDVDCNTAIGDGRLHLKAELPGKTGLDKASLTEHPATPEALLEVKQIPLQAGLDLLRTVRSGFAPGIVAAGVVNGSLSYKADSAEKASPAKGAKPLRHAVKAGKQVADANAVSDLTGSLKVEGGVLKGGGLSDPLVLPEIVWTPTLIPASTNGAGTGLGAKFTVPVPATAGAASGGAASQPMALQFALGAHGYHVGLGGSGSLIRLRDLGYAFGVPRADAADGFVGGAVDLDMAAEGPWIEPSDMHADSLTGSLQLHHTQWKSGFLAGAVDLPQAAIELSAGGIQFNSEFTYPARVAGKTAPGQSESAEPAALAGFVTITTPASTAGCKPVECVPQVGLRFAALDAEAIQAALLGVPAKKTLLSPLIDRIRSTERPRWPAASVGVQAESLVLGALTLRKPSVQMRIKDSEVVFEKWTATLLGGEASGTGSFAWGPDKPADKPQYSLVGDFSQVSGTALGTLLGTHWTGGPVSGSGKIRLAGFTDTDLMSSAMGDVSFRWMKGAVSTTSPPSALPLRPVHFDTWTGKVMIQDGEAKLGENQLLTGHSKTSVEGGLVFGKPVRLAAHASEK